MRFKKNPHYLEITYRQNLIATKLLQFSTRKRFPTLSVYHEILFMDVQPYFIRHLFSLILTSLATVCAIKHKIYEFVNMKNVQSVHDENGITHII